MIPSKEKSRHASRKARIGHVGIGDQRPQRPKEKSSNLCDEQGCANPNTYWVKFVSGRMGFYCEMHKDQLLRQGRVVRVEYFEKQ
jgi:hypothetical protein